MSNLSAARASVVSRLRARIYRYLKSALPDSWSIQLQHHHAHGRLANLKSPQTFSEKVQVRKLRETDARFSVYADKVLVKSIVNERLGEAYLIPTLWSGEVLPPRDQRRWPYPYVIKANHGCGWNIFVRTPEDEDWETIEAVVSGWLSGGYKPYLRESFYHQIRPQLLVEPLVGAADALPTDYKFFCFDGTPQYVMVQSDRHTQMQIATMDDAWNFTSLKYNYPRPQVAPAAPTTLEEMKRIARILSEGFDFVRIDLYDIDGRVMFGEYSFTPGSGFETFDPPTYNQKFGSLWRQKAQFPAEQVTPRG